MKVLLRDPQCDLYYAGPNLWVSDPGSAFDFETLDSADRASARERLKGVEIRLATDQAVCSFAIPVQLAA